MDIRGDSVPPNAAIVRRNFFPLLRAHLRLQMYEELLESGYSQSEPVMVP